MRSLGRNTVLALGLLLFTGGVESAHAVLSTQVTLGWNPSSVATTAGYYLSWGTSSGQYTSTNTYSITASSGTISNLSYDTTYYIAIASFSTNGQISPLSPEVVFLQPSPITTQPVVTNTVVVTGGPPAPGGSAPGGHAPGSSSGHSSTSGSSGSTASSGAGASAGAGSTASTGGSSSTTNMTQAQIWGVPPMLQMMLTNSTPTLSIGGTVGATVAIQTSTDVTSPYGWSTVTNVALTNAAALASQSAPGQVQDPIDLAFVPAQQNQDMPLINANGTMQFFRVVMPYDYAILAGSVLPTKGYAARLIMVNMPGTTDDCCYVTAANSYIHYNQTNSALQLASSGTSIRQIASTLANKLNLDWTTASEFVYSNGMGQILATVVQSDPASSDPVAGTTPTSSININF